MADILIFPLSSMLAMLNLDHALALPSVEYWLVQHEAVLLLSVRTPASCSMLARPDLLQRAMPGAQEHFLAVDREQHLLAEDVCGY